MEKWPNCCLLKGFRIASIIFMYLFIEDKENFQEGRLFHLDKKEVL